MTTLNDRLYNASEDEIVYEIIRQIRVFELADALKMRRAMGIDEAYMGGLWDLAFNEAKHFIFRTTPLNHIDDDDFYRYSYLAECVYHELVDMFDKELW